MRSRISRNGRVTIPRHLRVELGIGPGSLVDIQTEGDRLVMRRVGALDSPDALYGSLQMGESVDAYIERVRGR